MKKNIKLIGVAAAALLAVAPIATSVVPTTTANAALTGSVNDKSLPVFTLKGQTAAIAPNQAISDQVTSIGNGATLADILKAALSKVDLYANYNATTPTNSDIVTKEASIKD